MKLFCYLPTDNDAGAFYRATQPIAQLRRIMPNLEVYNAGDKIRMQDLAGMDVCFMPRPFADSQIAVLNLCQDLGVKVWVDYDDQLLAIPKESPASDYYEHAGVRAGITRMLQEADLVTVSTQGLADAFDDIVKRLRGYHVIPNAFNDYLFKQTPQFSRHHLAVWRGTESHRKDLSDYCPEIVKAAKKHEDWIFAFMGYRPWFILDELEKQAKYINGVDFFKYHNIIRQINPNIIIVPLTDNLFNHCKSNIAWIEGTYAGAVTLAPDWEEWKMLGIENYSSVEGFYRGLDFLLGSSEKNLKSMHSISWEYISTHLRLSEVNIKRKDLLQGLI